MQNKIQRALGRNAKTNAPSLAFASATYDDIGQIVVDSMGEYLTWGLGHDDGSALVTSIHSPNLRESALFSARNARIAYLLGKATLLGESERKGIVRTQIIEYGAVAEAILLDLIQCVGMQNKPPGIRPTTDSKGQAMLWADDGLLSRKTPNSTAMRYRFDLHWLINQAHRIKAIDSNLKSRIDWLRQSRNLVHPVIPTPQRYTDDVGSSRRARENIIALRDACATFKQASGI
jgi:hypothetical protein